MSLILFDLFDTLATQVHPDRPAQQAFADKLGLDLEQIRSWWKSQLRERMTDTYATYDEILRALCNALGATVDERTLTAINSARLEARRRYLHDVDAAVIDVLEYLRAKNWRLGLVSNAMPDEAAAWPGSPLTRHFEHVVFSCCAGCLKPEPQIYQLACAHFGASPHEVIFVGDGGFDELQGAAALGMRPVQANWYRKRTLKWDIEAVELISLERIEDLPGWLESI